MAEGLVTLFDNCNEDFESDCRLYGRGEFVIWKNDGHSWAQGETAPTFGRIRIPNVPANTLDSFMEPHNSEILDENGNPVMKRRRKMWLPIESLSAQQQADLQNGVTVEMTLGQLNQKMNDRGNN